MENYNSSNRPILKDDAVIGIINRGECAYRFIRSVQEYNIENNTALKTVAFYIDDDKDAPFVKYADYSCNFNKIPMASQSKGNIYINKNVLLKALDIMNCDAVWVGWGFVSEDSEFAELIEKSGRVLLGPSSFSMAQLGDKITAKELAEKSGVPILPWSKKSVKTIDEAKIYAKQIGYPVIIKAANTGGGRGIRFAYSEQEIEKQFTAAREETIRITGDDIVFMEHFIETGRHLEVQIAADRYGNVYSFGVRDCSVQRKNQKIIEETPPVNISRETLEDMQKSARALIKTAKYESVGTVEFIYCMKTEKFYFMEVNTRLQVEHPITEQLYNIDLIKIQIEVARGKELKFENLQPRGCAIELRLNAEDAENNFTPAPGKILNYKIPAGAGIRIDSGIDSGSTIPTKFDSMIAKIIGYGQSRSEVLSRLERALDEINILIDGGATNRAFLKALLKNPDIRKGAVSTRFVEELLQKTPKIIERKNWHLAMIATAIEQFAKKYIDDINNFKNQFNRGGYLKTLELTSDKEITISHNGVNYNFFIEYVGNDIFHIKINGKNIVVKYIWEQNESIMFFYNKRFIVQMIERGNITQCELNGTPYPFELEAKGIIKSPTPAMVLSIPVKKGDRISQGQLLIVLEAMKMESAVTAPADGIISEILVREGEQIAAGQILIKIEGNETAKKTNAETAGKIEQIDFSELEIEIDNIQKHNQTEIWDFITREYLGYFLGFDIKSKPSDAIQRILIFTRRFSEYNEKIIQLFINAIEIYFDIEILFSNIQYSLQTINRNVSISELLMHYFKRPSDAEKGMPEDFLTKLKNAMRWYNSSKLHNISQDTRSIFRIYRAHSNINIINELLLLTLFELQDLFEKLNFEKVSEILIEKLGNLAALTKSQYQRIADVALNLQYLLMSKYRLNLIKDTRKSLIEELLKSICSAPENFAEKRKYVHRAICESSRFIILKLIEMYNNAEQETIKNIALELLARRFNRDRKYKNTEYHKINDIVFCIENSFVNENIFRCLLMISALDKFKQSVNELLEIIEKQKICEIIVLITEANTADIVDISKILTDRRLSVEFLSIGYILKNEQTIEFQTYTTSDNGCIELNENYMSLFPNAYREFNIQRLAKFKLELLYKDNKVYIVNATARNNKKDERLFAFVNVYDANPVYSEDGMLKNIFGFENSFMDAILTMRNIQAKRKQRLLWNQIIINIHSYLKISLPNVEHYGKYLVKHIEGLGIEKIVIHAPSRPYGQSETDILKSSKKYSKSGGILEYTFEIISNNQYFIKRGYVDKSIIEPIDDYTMKVIKAKQRGCLYPYEIIKLLTRKAAYIAAPAIEKLPRSEFEEYDIIVENNEQKIISVNNREYGQNTSNIVFGVISNKMSNYDYSFKRVIILSDPTSDVGSLAEQECRRIIAALDLAEKLKLPVEWIATSAGARIDMNSGTENLDWTAAVLRRIIEFTQFGGEINIIVVNVNVGAQSYWNAEATMLMHTKGILIMLEESSMLLTGKKALDYSGSVSAENNVGIGGVERIMGPNGQAQFRAADIIAAYNILFKHYEFTYAPQNLKYPPKFNTLDSIDRNVCEYSYNDTLNQGFKTIGDILLAEKNPERKKPFDMRQVMNAVIDTDASYLERWQMMKDAETAIVWETRIGGYSCGLIGIESKPLARVGEIPNDGPETWTGGTLFPLSSKKTARAINALSNKLPLVVLANLSGFDGSPESMRKCQLEFGAEIGRAIVNFQGPIIFIVISRYHGGAYVVFSKRLNSSIKAAAIEGTFASVIGGASAAAVVFNKQVIKETLNDSRIIEAQKKLQSSGTFNKREYDELYKQVLNEKQSMIAQQFDKIHSVERAIKVGSIDEIIKAETLRRYIIENLSQNIDKKI